MRALVIGATGVVGHFLLPRLAAAGLEVHAVSRQPRDELAPLATWHPGDIGIPGWQRGMPPMDVVFHLAPLWLLPPVLSDLRELGTGRLIAFGSTSRHTKAESTSPAERKVAARLMVAETRLAREADFCEWTLFRPTLIYGAGLDQNVSSIARFVQRFGFFPLVGRAQGLRQPVHADDLAAVCVTALGVHASHRCTLDLGGGEVLGFREMVLRIFGTLGRPARLPRLPAAGMKAAVGLASRLPGFRHLDVAMVARMSVDMTFDNTPARLLLGYSPREFRPTAADLGCAVHEPSAKRQP